MKCLGDCGKRTRAKGGVCKACREWEAGYALAEQRWDDEAELMDERFKGDAMDRNNPEG